MEKICQFLGKKLEPEELNSVIKNSSFQAMKENNMSNFSLLKGQYLEENGLLLRKGKRKCSAFRKCRSYAYHRALTVGSRDCLNLSTYIVHHLKTSLVSPYESVSFYSTKVGCMVISLICKAIQTLSLSEFNMGDISSANSNQVNPLFSLTR